MAQATGYGNIFEPQQSKVNNIKNPINIVNEVKIHKADTTIQIQNLSKVLGVSFSSV